MIIAPPSQENLIYNYLLFFNLGALSCVNDNNSTISICIRTSTSTSNIGIGL